MFIPATEICEATNKDGEITLFSRLVLVPASVIAMIHELQSDDADECKLYYDAGARSAIELPHEFMYVTETIETLNNRIQGLK